MQATPHNRPQVADGVSPVGCFLAHREAPAEGLLIGTRGRDGSYATGTRAQQVAA
jgi:hypothetical protein